jgi:gamma-glutamyl:cysteine ligase YbdK (ATP-grasp superfamily)
MVVEELAQFNVEINTSPQRLEGNCLQTMQAELGQIWQTGRDTATDLSAELLSVGILPTLSQADLSLDYISDRSRYRALNEQVMQLHGGHPIQLNISGHQPLSLNHPNIMVEAATTSFQIHLQIPLSQAVRYFNAAQILSAPMVAIAANSPYLFGHDLWSETRIPLFEQVMAPGEVEPWMMWPAHSRVSFGEGYVQETMFEWFASNLARYPVLLPEDLGIDPTRFPHLRLHNGTIWPWNRPLIGFNDDGSPHLRLEHRVVSAPPSLLDAIANAAFFFGSIYMLATQPEPPETQLPFSQARSNFYTAARDGLHTRVTWLVGKPVELNSVLLNCLLPLARRGLRKLGVDRADIDLYLSPIEGRLQTGQTGSVWQKSYVAKHGPNMSDLTAAYLARQCQGLPVHEWTV